MQETKPEDPYAPYPLVNNEWYWMDRHVRANSENTYRNSEAIRQLTKTCLGLSIALGAITAPVIYLFCGFYFSSQQPLTITIEKPLPTPSPLLPALPQSN